MKARQTWRQCNRIKPLQFLSWDESESVQEVYENSHLQIVILRELNYTIAYNDSYPAAGGGAFGLSHVVVFVLSL